MSAESLIKWPMGNCFSSHFSTWTESTHPQKQMNAAGEKFGFLYNFDGSAIESISIPLGAGTAATTISLSIEGQDTTANTNNVSAMPDGTAITNGTASVSSKGGTAEWVTWTFGSAPAPVGLHWIVIAPSGGSFDILVPYVTDWHGDGNNSDGSFGNEKLYTTAWSGLVTLGVSPMRVKRTDGSYHVNHGHPWFSTTGGETINYRQPDSTTCVGVKFVAPYDIELAGATMQWTSSVFHYTEFVLVDDSDTELGRCGHAYGITTNTTVSAQFGRVSLTAGSTYRIYVTNPADSLQSGYLATVDISAGQYDLLGLSPGDWEYTTADDPPAEGGVGAWTDTATEIPLMFLVGYQDLGALAGGGGGGGQTAHTFAV